MRDVTYGERLRAARKARGLTMDELAAALGTSRQTVARWEKHGAQPWAYHERIAEFFGDEGFLLRLSPEARRDRLDEIEAALEEALRRLDKLEADGQRARPAQGDGAPPEPARRAPSA